MGDNRSFRKKPRLSLPPMRRQMSPYSADRRWSAQSSDFVPPGTHFQETYERAHQPPSRFRSPSPPPNRRWENRDNSYSMNTANSPAYPPYRESFDDPRWKSERTYFGDDGPPAREPLYSTPTSTDPVRPSPSAHPGAWDRPPPPETNWDDRWSARRPPAPHDWDRHREYDEDRPREFDPPVTHSRTHDRGWGSRYPEPLPPLNSWQDTSYVRGPPPPELPYNSRHQDGDYRSPGRPSRYRPSDRFPSPPEPPRPRAFYSQDRFEPPLSAISHASSRASKFTGSLLDPSPSTPSSSASRAYERPLSPERSPSAEHWREDQSDAADSLNDRVLSPRPRLAYEAPLIPEQRHVTRDYPRDPPTRFDNNANTSGWPPRGGPPRRRTILGNRSISPGLPYNSPYHVPSEPPRNGVPSSLPYHSAPRPALNSAYEGQGHSQPHQYPAPSDELHRPRVSFAEDDPNLHDSRSEDSRAEPPRSPLTSPYSPTTYSPEYSPELSPERSPAFQDIEIPPADAPNAQDSMDSESTPGVADQPSFSPVLPPASSPREQSVEMDDVESQPETGHHIAQPTTPSPPTSPPPDTFDDALLASYGKRSSIPLDDEVTRLLKFNQSLLDAPGTRISTSPEALVEEFMSGPQLEDCLGLHDSMRSALVSQFASRDTALNDKVQRLREQYKALNDPWQIQCQRIDRLDDARRQKQAALAASEEAAVVSSRSSRRSANLGLFADAVRSDLEMEQVIATLGNEDLTDPNFLAIRNTATIPDMISVTDRWEEGCQYDDTNGIVSDPEKFFSPDVSLGHWSDEEKSIFLQQYASVPKQFGKIATFLPHKTAQQCVLYYYLNKKEINFRSILMRNGSRGRRGGGRRSGKQKGNALLADIRAPRRDEDEESPAHTPMSDYPPPRRRRTATDDTRANKPAASRSRNRVSDVQEGNITTEPRRRRGGPRQPQVPVADAESTREPTPAAGAQTGQTNGAAAEEGADAETPDVPPKKTRARRKPRGEAADGKEAPRRRGTTSSYWSVQDRSDFLRGLHAHGKDWTLISEQMTGKTPVQVRNYFQNHSEELGLREIVRNRDARLTREQEAQKAGETQSPHEVPSSQLQSLPHLTAHPPRSGLFVPSPGTHHVLVSPRINPEAPSNLLPVSAIEPIVKQESETAPAAKGGMQIRNLLNDDAPDPAPAFTRSRDALNHWFGAAPAPPPSERLQHHISNGTGISHSPHSVMVSHDNHRLIMGQGFGLNGHAISMPSGSRPVMHDLLSFPSAPTQGYERLTSGDVLALNGIYPYDSRQFSDLASKSSRDMALPSRQNSVPSSQIPHSHPQTYLSHSPMPHSRLPYESNNSAHQENQGRDGAVDHNTHGSQQNATDSNQPAPNSYKRPW